ncbi:hypothetical protein BDA99DRAFT_183161 [Phascolomyces articulosus]|uniref:VOC domain-containing protein n=1 Tax=Phascolomyces articulosus TaxID=60185 RepID=A0AAD5JS54_9FUNG|nr:hypothetical protein BDA99DRAFT_183161 [Phascolomyces articulosus]
MPHGLSHIVLHACTAEDFDRTLHFYTSLGFEKILEQEYTDGADERRVWLKLKAAEHTLTTDMTVKLTLTATAMRRPQPSADLDWSLEETGFVLSTIDIQVKKNIRTYGFVLLFVSRGGVLSSQS